MAACAHPELFNDEDEGGMKYIEFNQNFKMDCSILLEKVTQYVGTKVKQDFNSNYFDNSIRYLPEGETLDSGTLACNDNNTTVDQITELTDTEFSSMLHSDLSGTQYKNVASVMKQRFGEKISLDSNYKIAKRRPKMEIGWLRKKFSHHYDDFEPASGSDGEDEEDEALLSDIHLQQTTMKKKTKKRKRKKKTNNSQRNNVRKRKAGKMQPNPKPKTKKKEPTLEEVHRRTRKKNEQKQGIHACRFMGGIKQAIDLLVQEIKTTSGIKIEGKFILTNCVDGANYAINKHTDSSVTSYNLQCWGESIKKELPVGSSHGVLTYQQIGAPEKLEYIREPMEVVLKDLQDMQKNGELKIDDCDIYHYEMHDGKMLYCITQHSQWNRLHHGFLRCGCKRGAGVAGNDTHQCHMWTNSEEIKYYNLAADLWQLKKTNLDYDIDDHKDWCDEHNFGITDLGIDPSLLLRECIRFDIFHMSKSNSVKILSHVRLIIFKHSTEYIKSFEKQLERFGWRRFSVDIFIMNKNLNIFDGSIIKKFSETAAEIGQYMEDTIESNPEVKAIVKVLKLWFKIYTFLKKADVDHTYPAEIKQFEVLVKELYECGKHTFLTSAGSDCIGDAESFYMHAMRFYIPQIARHTFETFQVGVGVWSMQQFERRNAEAKTLHKNCTNKRGNWIKQIMKRLYDKFIWSRYKKKEKKKNKKGKNNQLEHPSEAEEEVAETKETIIEF